MSEVGVRRRRQASPALQDMRSEATISMTAAVRSAAYCHNNFKRGERYSLSLRNHNGVENEGSKFATPQRLVHHRFGSNQERKDDSAANGT